MCTTERSVGEFGVDMHTACDTDLFCHAGTPRCPRSSEPTMLSVHQEISAGVVICRPAGELDAFTVSQLRETLAGLAGTPHLVLDLSNVTFIDTGGLGALVGGIRRTRDLGGEVAIACNRPVLVRLLHTTGFERIVTIAPDVPTAILAFVHQQPA